MRQRPVARTFPLDLVAIVVAVGAAAGVLGAALHFYAGGAFMEAISYVSDERPLNAIVSSLMGTDPGASQIGIHAFGDYLLPRYWVTLESPWLMDATGGMNYLSTPLVVFKLLGLLPYRAGLFVYEAAMALALMAPAYIALSGRRWSVRLLAAITLGLLAGPSIASLDRGNTQGFLPILLFGFAVAVLRARWGWATVFLVAVASIKVYPIVLVLVLLALRKWRWAGISIAATGLVAIATLPLVSRDVWPSLKLMVTDIVQFGDRDFNEFMSYNASVAGGIAHAFEAVGWAGLSHQVASHAALVGIAYLLVVAPLLWFTALDLWVRVIVAMMLTTGVMPIVYPYALNWVVAASALALYMAVGSRGARGSGEVLQPRGITTLLLLALGLLTAVYPFLIPGTATNGYPTGAISLVNAAVCLAVPVTLWVTVLRDRARPSAAVGTVHQREHDVVPEQ